MADGTINNRIPDWDAGGLDVTKANGIVSNRCGVCKSGYNIMAFVNRQYVNGSPASEIYQMLQEFPPDTFPKNRVPAYSSVQRHLQNHLPIKQRAFAKTMEIRAKEMGKDIENGAENLLTNQARIDNIAAVGYSRIVEGKLEPSVQETMKAIELSEKFQREASQDYDAVSAMNQVNRIMKAIKKVLPESYMIQIYDELAKDMIEDATIIDIEENTYPEIGS